MLRKLLSTLSIIVASAGLMLAQNEAAIKVKLTDKANKEPIPFANIVVEMGGIQSGVGTTSIDGEVTIKPLNPGKYNVKALYVGYQSVEISNITVSVGKTVYLNMEMTAGHELEAVEVVSWSEPLIDPDTKSGSTVTREEYQNMATKDINSVAATTAGIYQKDEGGELNVRGARASGTSYYVDGQKVIGSPGVAQSAVEQITTIIGGTPAEYGDATGGIISITTRGPSSTYGGGVELISSGFGEKKGLDAFGYNFIGFSVNGPLLTKKDTVDQVKKSVLGFSFSGEAFNEKDPDPSAIGFYQVKKDVLRDLEAAPLRPSAQGGFVLNSEYITAADMEKIKARNNVASNSMRLNGKIQYQPTTNLGITLGGSVDYNNRHNFVYEYALFNPVNNPQTISNTWRAFAKLTQKFSNATAKEEEKSSSIIKNAYFTLQAGYSKEHGKTQDDNHKDKYFDYGYIGKFVQSKVRNYDFKENEGRYDVDGDGTKDTVSAFFQTGFRDAGVSFTPSDVNPTGVPYTNQVFASSAFLPNLDAVQANLGMRNGDRPESIYSLWYNTGRQYGGASAIENSQFRVFTNFSADIKKHAVQVGFEYEQRVQRAFSVSAIGLWTQMRALANAHLSQMDTTPTLNADFSGTYQYYDFNRLNDGTQRQFDKSLREKLGYNVNGTDWIDIDSYDPSTYSLDMFSPDDLSPLGPNQYVSCNGYDYTGKKLKGNPSLDDFFNKKDANGNFTRQIGAYQPIYISGYIQDKFDFRDLKFNIGVRVDRFDANQKVLKDKYLLYEAKTAGEINFIQEFGKERPSNIGDDYVVYVNDALTDHPSGVEGFRNGDTWYNSEGVEIDNPVGLKPYLLDPSAARNKKISSKVFEDYTPQINVMPRIAFSFPISDVASFFAHYDVLTQRPSDGYSRMDPFSYMNMENNTTGYISNPNLKPERTTDYELGFSQVLNEKKNSAITLSTFYREMRDMIQVVQVNNAYPITYSSWDNIDFGTTKGFSFAYDLRRITSGVQLTASYTLQFADGTGSSASDGVNLAASGKPNLRTTHALDFDQRHTVVLNVDYRFGNGKEYDGPEWTFKKGSDNEKIVKLLENVGANIVLREGSGTPYSKQENITQDAAFGISERKGLTGMVNGSNLPWNFKIDLRIDKDLEIKWKKGKDGDEEKRAALNIYLQILNVLNTKNITNIYKATGNPNDDGYLASANGQLSLAKRNSAESFADLYNVKVNDPAYYSRPRVIRIGLLLSF